MPMSAPPCSGWACTALQRTRKGSRPGTLSGTAISAFPPTTHPTTSSPRSPAPSGRSATAKVDPLGGLAVTKVIGLGASQSAGRLGTYINAVHPLPSEQGGHAFDGYMLQIYFGSGAPIEASDRPVNPTSANMRLPRGQNLIRDDLEVPAMIVNTELEAIACLSVRQPDTETASAPGRPRPSPTSPTSPRRCATKSTGATSARARPRRRSR